MRPSSDTVVAGVLILTGALWLTFSGIHRFHLGDSLLPTLVSLQAWTPFFWGQERLGMLEALVAMPLRAPMANLLFQVAVFTLASVGVAFVLARTVTPEPRRWMTAGAAFVLAIAAGLGDREQFRFFVLHHEYAVGLTLGALGLLAVPLGGAPRAARRWALAALLFALAQWVNISVAVPLVVLAFGRPLAQPRAFGAASPWPRAALTAGIVGATFAANAALARTQGPARYGVLPIGEWPGAVGRLAEHAWADHGLAVAGLAAAAALTALLAGAVGRGRPALIAGLRAGGPLIAAGVGHGIFMGALDHVQIAGADSRYAFIALMGVGTGLAVVAASCAAEAWPRVAAPLARCAILAMVPALAAVHGMPAPGLPWEALPARWRARAQAVVDAGCTHIVGSYEAVWPAVFAASVIRWRAGDDTPIWGIASRAGPAYALWGDGDRRTWRVAFVEGDAEPIRDALSAEYGLDPLALVERRGPIRVYRVGGSARGGSGTQ